MRAGEAFVLFIVLAARATTAATDCTPELPDASNRPAEVDPAALQRQADALRAMSLDSIDYSLRGPIKFIRGQTGIVLPADIAGRKEGDSADDILPLVADVFLANGTESFRVKDNEFRNGSERRLRLEQFIGDMPVDGAVVLLAYDETTRRVSAFGGQFVPDRGLPRTPQLSAAQAEQVVPRVLSIAEKLDPSSVAIEEGSHLGYFADEFSPEPVQLVWVVEATLGSYSQEVFLVDAITGIVAHRRPKYPGGDLWSGNEPNNESNDVVGAECECSALTPEPAERPKVSPSCGHLYGMGWPPVPGERYLGQIARADLGWPFAAIVIDGELTRCVCKVSKPSYFRMRACNSCGCGPWGKVRFLDVKSPCP
jgi:hypothetical protein